MEQIILFGDSITQQIFSSPGPDDFNFGAALSNDYIRRLDVVNRGFSGYNTRQALWLLPRILPSAPTVRLFIICFGANDARRPDTGVPEQHIPLEDFAENLKAIVRLVREAQPRARVLLITPPPVHESMLAEGDNHIGRKLRPNRLAVLTRRYAHEAWKAAREAHVPVMDLWGRMICWAQGEEFVESQDHPLGVMRDDFNPVGLPGIDMVSDLETTDEIRHLDAMQEQHDRLKILLRDGLHLTSVGYRIFYETLQRSIRTHFPELTPEQLKFTFPAWNTPGPWT